MVERAGPRAPGGTVFRTVFDATGDAILLADVDTRSILDANPAASTLFGYTRAELLTLRTVDLLHPDSLELHAQVAGRQHEHLAVVGRRKDGSPIDIDVSARTVADDGQAVRCVILRAITEGARAHELMEARVAQRTRQLTALLRVSQALSGTLELRRLLDLVLDQLAGVVDYTEAIIAYLEGDELCVHNYRGALPRDQALAIRQPVERTPIFQAVLQRRGPVIVSHLEQETALAAASRAGGLRPAPPDQGTVGSILGVPLVSKDRIIGLLRLDHAQPGFYTQAHADLALAIANQASIAIENARLFAAERSTRERLDVALEAGQMGAWEWDIATNVVTWSAQLEAIHGLPPGTFAGTFEAYLADIHPDDLDHVRNTIEHSLRSGEHHLEYRIVWPDGSVHWVEASGRVITDGHANVVGLRGVCQDITHRKTQEAEQVRLQARERAASEARAALEERQRLARELHDSVSQALYGIALGSQTALAALQDDRDVAAADTAVSYVHRLAEAAIAEMRALIFELRPESLEQHGLAAALERQVASLRARHALHVEATLAQEHDVALDKQQALYRIAQESLHNATRHAHAQAIRVSLQQANGRVILEVADDGIGFDPSAQYPGHLGLVSMRERAAAAGGSLSIESRPGCGTRVTAEVPI